MILALDNSHYRDDSITQSLFSSPQSSRGKEWYRRIKAKNNHHRIDRSSLDLFPLSMNADDDNDIELANVVKRAYIPTITSTSMREQVQQHPERFVVAKEEAMWATEEILTIILASILGINVVTTHNNTTW